MPKTQRSLEETLALMARYGGTRWPNPWWPSGNSNYDDCAAAVSWALFGLNSYNNPFYSYVSQIQNYFSGLGRRTWGRSGIQRGDVLAFSWTQDPNSFDHTEIALGPVSPSGLITSRGTNSNPGDDMRDRTRSASYVVSFSRPDYAGGSSSASDGNATLIPAETPIQEDDMALYTRIGSGQGTGQIYFQEKHGDPLYPLTGDEWAAAAAGGAKYANLDAQQVQALQRKLGYYPLDPKYGRRLKNADGSYQVLLPG